MQNPLQLGLLIGLQKVSVLCDSMKHGGLDACESIRAVSLRAARAQAATPADRRYSCNSAIVTGDFDKLVQYVEEWNWFFKGSLPAAIARQISTDQEKKLYPLYDDLQQQVDRLRRELVK